MLVCGRPYSTWRAFVATNSLVSSIVPFWTLLLLWGYWSQHVGERTLQQKVMKLKANQRQCKVFSEAFFMFFLPGGAILCQEGLFCSMFLCGHLSPLSYRFNSVHWSRLERKTIRILPLTASAQSRGIRSYIPDSSFCRTKSRQWGLAPNTTC